MARGDKQIRIPGIIIDAAQEAAIQNHRSLNAEIVAALSSVYSTNPEPNQMAAKSNNLTIRISDETKERLDRLSKRGPYRISITSIVERGIELAAEELEALK